MDYVEEVEASVHAALNQLVEQAENLLAEYMTEFDAASRDRPQREMGTLIPRVRDRRNEGRGVEIAWNRLVPYRPKGKPKWHGHSQIRMGRGRVSYSRETLSRHAQEWEVELALTYEDAFTTIRQQIKAWQNILKELNRIRRVHQVDADEGAS